MNAIKYLAYFNIIYSLLLIWTINSLYSYGIDYSKYVFTVLNIWYSWETIKQLKGIRNNLNRINLIVGILILIIGGLNILGGLAFFIFKDFSTDKNFLIGLIFLLILYIPGFAFVVATLKFYYRNKKLTEN